MDPTEDPARRCAPDGAVMAGDAWESLLDRIGNGLVVPVVGSQLLNDAADTGRPMARVAARLLELHRLTINAGSLTPGRELEEAIALLQRDGKIWQLDLYEAVHKAIGYVTKDDASIPLPIRQLATIADFRLMVTVTPDDMLARCLRRRCSVNEIIHSPNFTRPGSLNDLPEDWQSRSGGEVHLLYLFGKSQFAPVFAIHEEDVLEYAHNVIARGSNVPNAFRGELREKDLLFIGCAVDTGRTPQPIGQAHLSDQAADLPWYPRPTTTTARLPAPTQPEALLMPPDDGLRLHNRHSVQHRRKQAIEPDEEQSTRQRQLWPRGNALAQHFPTGAAAERSRPPAAPAS